MTTDPAARPFRPGELTTHADVEALSKVTRTLRAAGRRVTLVPTMGALHAGHRELIRHARRVPNSVTVVSVFVNPLQFGDGEDFDRYPRDLASDLEVCRSEGVELVFAPTAERMYPHGRSVSVRPGPLGDELEGAARAGHFEGVLTVVAKLFNIVRPDVAFFGEKDYQQLVLVRRMARELNLDTAVVGVPTVREPRGLALSSRNARLREDQRAAAVALSAALTAAVHTAGAGAATALATAREVLAAEPALDVDYLELRGPDLEPAPEEGSARLLVAARIGDVRLIDNAPLVLSRPDDTASGTTFAS
ncbi:pantoate--beta-alanine ligase [Actinoalloteichus caeruleus]|uniref:pantoate--beta-alanine ligase n=1 Tax=Actinoalloteichus cyanogriseus TaxID=2893586 RepID=UPI0004A9E1E1|nr:pantoate--beta-alanine ligase [Actinoalloteichus caeruleus]